MILIGSAAAQFHDGIKLDREVADYDFIVEGHRLPEILKTFSGKAKLRPLDESHAVLMVGKTPVELELAWPDSTGAELIRMAREQSWSQVWVQVGDVRIGAYLAPISVLYALKLSHRYKRNSPHFLKTMRDIRMFREYRHGGPSLRYALLEWLKRREAETYSYQHPNLKRSKAQFFADDAIQYVYDHDSLHLAVASYKTAAGPYEATPVYKLFSVDGQEVLSSKSKFNLLSNYLKCLAVLEESYVLALERSQIPFDFKPERKRSFDIALEKVCTSITSGWFREFAWENYTQVQAMYNDDYVDRFHGALVAGVAKPFKKEMM